jgi:ketosteroid isomerase-like protein
LIFKKKESAMEYTQHPATNIHDLILHTFATIEAKDIEALLTVFADDAMLIDPHFPAIQMRGKAAIATGLREAVNGMQTFGYTIEHYFESENGRCAAVETATQHIIRGGKKLNFPQVFVFETANGCITRMQAYEPYGPHGIIGLFLSLARLKQRIFGK